MHDFKLFGPGKRTAAQTSPFVNALGNLPKAKTWPVRSRTRRSSGWALSVEFKTAVPVAAQEPGKADAFFWGWGPAATGMNASWASGRKILFP
ncbi:hypothetical protein GCM10022409_00900 [Hymenobacter glaciei]|uniref:Uncharacterized protein n=1 Tax=Hymenobacter glaciei TaxID=877209 RepID=A0ABP7T4Z3_9BACT